MHLIHILHAETMQCYLFKRARTSGRNWKRRWFKFEQVSSGWTLSYWKDEGQTQKNKPPSGSVSLLSSNKSGIVRPIYAEKDYAIEILPGDGSPPLIVAAEDSVKYKEIIAMFGAFVHSVKAGWLYKRARKSGRNWRRRWFELDITDACLRIFESADSSCKANSKGLQQNANDCLQLSAQSRIQISGLRKYCIELLPKEGELSLFVAAESEERYKQWQIAFSRLTSSFSSAGAGSNLVATRQTNAETAEATLKKSLSKKGSSLFAAAVGHVSEPQHRADNKHHSAPPSRPDRGPPKRRVSTAGVFTNASGGSSNTRHKSVAPAPRKGRGPPPRRATAVPGSNVRRGPPPRAKVTKKISEDDEGWGSDSD